MSRSEKLPAATRWQRWAQQSMEDDLFALRRTLCERVLELAGGHERLPDGGDLHRDPSVAQMTAGRTTGTYTGDPPPGLTARGVFVGRSSSEVDCHGLVIGGSSCRRGRR